MRSPFKIAPWSPCPSFCFDIAGRVDVGRQRFARKSQLREIYLGFMAIQFAHASSAWAGECASKLMQVRHGLTTPSLPRSILAWSDGTKIGDSIMFRANSEGTPHSANEVRQIFSHLKLAPETSSLSTLPAILLAPCPKIDHRSFPLYQSRQECDGLMSVLGKPTTKCESRSLTTDGSDSQPTMSSRCEKMDVPTPETLKFLQTVLEETWESLRPEERARTSKTQVAAHILRVAATGERDPVRLRAEARSRGAHFER